MLRVPAAARESLVLRRVARRVRARGLVRPEIARPIGLKAELTHRCNLRCGFCYTDSPRRTLEGETDLSDERWRSVVDEALALGIVEAVVSGGEPLLRRELALELIERLTSAGVGVSLNTNGWFVDAALADRLAALPGLRVHVSVDGASPQVHDAARGVPGSWRRAVRALDLLLARGVPVQAIHVVGPASVGSIEACLEHLWLLGVRAIGVSPVSPVGAASRDPGWLVGSRAGDRAIRAFRERHGDEVDFTQPEPVESLAARDVRPPASLLVRPDGTVVPDAMHPFSFGTVDDGLAACWEALRTGWRDRRIDDWARGIRRVRDMPDAALVPYRDRPVSIAGSKNEPAAGRRSRRGTLLGPPPRIEPTDLGEARETVVGLALARRHRLARVRWAGSADGDRYVRVVARGRVVRVNATTGLVMDACAEGTPADALARLAARHPSVPRERLMRDVLGAVARLREQGVLLPAPA